MGDVGEQEMARRTSAPPWSSGPESFNSTLSSQPSESLNEFRHFCEIEDEVRQKENIKLPPLRSIFPNLPRA